MQVEKSVECLSEIFAVMLLNHAKEHQPHVLTLLQFKLRAVVVSALIILQAFLG